MYILVHVHTHIKNQQKKTLREGSLPKKKCIQVWISGGHKDFVKLIRLSFKLHPLPTVNMVSERRDFITLQRSHSALSFSLMLLTRASMARNIKVLSYTYSYFAFSLRSRINLCCLKRAQWQRPKATANINSTESFFFFFFFLSFLRKEMICFIENHRQMLLKQEHSQCNSLKSLPS